MARKADCSVIIKNPEYEKTKQAQNTTHSTQHNT
jgi:hypothetical protein